MRTDDNALECMKFTDENMRENCEISSMEMGQYMQRFN